MSHCMWFCHCVCPSVHQLLFVCFRHLSLYVCVCTPVCLCVCQSSVLEYCIRLAVCDDGGDSVSDSIAQLACDLVLLWADSLPSSSSSSLSSLSSSCSAGSVLSSVLSGDAVSLCVSAVLSLSAESPSTCNDQAGCWDGSPSDSLHTQPISTSSENTCIASCQPQRLERALSVLAVMCSHHSMSTALTLSHDLRLTHALSALMQRHTLPTNTQLAAAQW